MHDIATHALTISATTCRHAALDGSYERLFHDSGLHDSFLPLDSGPLRAALEPPRLERAIGVIYLPQSERVSHYFRASLPRQFDFVVHADTTRALQALETTAPEHTGEPVETYPTGM